MTVVAPPLSIGQAEIDSLQAVNTDWISLVPYGFSKIGDPAIQYNLDGQWWGEKKKGIVICTKLAHDNNIKVMLKPQVYIHESWVGEVDFDTESEWLEWEESYRAYIHFYGHIAAENDIELFCIGTEYKIAVNKRSGFWRQIIKELRSYYDGKVIYSANWDEYEDVSIWDAVDFVGISAYFPLVDHKTPTINTLKNKWRPIKNKLSKFSKKHRKKIIFTEYGYLSIDRCAWQAWELEKGVRNKNINELAQANAYHSLLKTFWKEEWWGGGFLWKWFPSGMGHEGYPERDYTPQGKLSQKVITDWYGKEY
ncbi:MAG: hypothetical protein V3V14_10095 [Saprospiraceae bacterium]